MLCGIIWQFWLLFTLIFLNMVIHQWPLRKLIRVTNWPETNLPTHLSTSLREYPWSNPKTKLGRKKLCQKKTKAIAGLSHFPSISELVSRHTDLAWNVRSPLQLRELPLWFKLAVPELLVPPLWRAVWLESVLGKLAWVEQNVGQVATDRQVHPWARIWRLQRHLHAMSDCQFWNWPIFSSFLI